MRSKGGLFQLSSSEEENELIYRSQFSDDDDHFRDIVYGTCGVNVGDFADPGWDFCTGIGSNIGLHGK